MTESAQAEYLSLLDSDPAFFLQELWDDRDLSGVAPLGEIELDIACYLAGVDPSWGKRRIALAPRGVGKTTFGTCALTCWRLYRDIDRRVVIVSKSGGSAAESMSLIRDWIENCWFLKHLAPRKKLGDRDNTEAIDVRGCKKNRQPSVKCLGIDGQLPSNRAHSVFADDVETPENTKTKAARDDLQNTTREFDRWLYSDVNKDDLPICRDPVEIGMIGTYQHEDSLYMRWPNAKSPVDGTPAYHRRVWPLCYPRVEDKIDDLAPLILANLSSGKARYSKDETDFVNNGCLPYRYPKSYVASKMAGGLHPFLQQYMLLSSLANVERYPLRLQDLAVMELPDDPVGPTSVTWGKANQDGSTALEIRSIGHGDDRLYGPICIGRPGEKAQYAPYTGTCMWIDAAGGGKGDSTDATGIAIVSHLAGNLFGRYLGGTKGGHTQDIYHEWARLARKYRVTHVCIEHNASRGLLNQAFMPILAEYRIAPGTDDKIPEGWSASIVDDSKLMHSYGMKEERIIATLQPVLGDHRLIVTPEVAANEQLQFQLTRIQAQKNCLGHDDEIDALAGACRFFEYTLRMDRTKATTRIHEARRQKSLVDQIREQFGGRAPTKASVLRRLF